jgi:SAM-dependent methyltransferase
VLDQDRMAERALAVVTSPIPALDDTRDAFDGVADDYDRTNAGNPTLLAIRHRVLGTITTHVPPRSRVLDLGCGPGADAETLARAGYSVVAIDWSPAMVDAARRRISVAGLAARVQVLRTGIHELDSLPREAFDAAYSNFGSLNCVPSLADAARLLAERLRPGGVFVASVIGRICPWEIALFLCRGDLDRVRVRFARDFVPVPLNGRRVWTRYYGAPELERAFSSAGFHRLSLRALGLVVPPPYMEAFVARHPRFVRALQRFEDSVAGWPVIRGWGDHFLIVLERAR